MAFFIGTLITVALFFGVRGTEEELSDASCLLQASLEEKIRAAADEIDYGDRGAVGSSSVTCESFKRGNILDEEYASATPVADSVAAALPEASLVQRPVQEDPPGAATFKAVLELMIVILFVDGLRRWRIQRNETPRQKKVADTSMEDDAVDRAWEELLKSALAGDETSFKKIDLEKSHVKRDDMWGCTALHFAATGGSTEIATDLLQLGAEVNAVDACDETALHFAARAGHVSMCDLLLNKGASVNPLNEQDMTPLVVAGHAREEATCRFLVDHGANAGGMADEDLPLMVVGQVMRKVLEGI
mmetsp:Transcript_42601/g.66439  ORF Transcript_42601/g.66439 Transcript_42601/m.66439 type:complete len:303 (-) Transcript_42601:160-1068(-)